ncbi:MAG TPA: methylmalonyl-CoA mutase family protein [Actinomycetota bacterium]|nr:methylmalonyl-CoA mutase family protein [Actinomycetota bacterium]
MTEREAQQARLEQQRARWRERYQASGERDADFTTVSGEPVPPLATPEERDVAGSVGFPGEFPYTRGVYSTMYRGRPWTIRQFSGFGNVTETNARYRYLIAQGGGGLSVAFDMPTLMGRDSDDPRSRGEVGHCGVAVDSAADMEILFDGLPLDKLTTSMTISGPAPMLFAMYVVAAERQRADVAKLDGTLQTDILKEYIAQKEWLFPPEPHLRLIGDLLEYCAAEVPKYHPISVSGYHIREAGSTAAQELAFTLADGFAYIELARRRGLDPVVVAQQLSFFFDAHIDFFEEIGKFRAARRIWARWMRDRYGIGEPKAQQLKFHTQTAGVSLTAQQPGNNVVRTALEALSAVLGGTQSLHTNALDEVFALPTERAAAIALRTQQVIAEETGVAATIDPLGGSWYVERMTDLMERRAEELFAQIDRFGDGSMLDGVLAGIERGWFQQQMADAAFAYQQALEKGSKVVVGVNKYVTDDDQELEILRITEQVEREQRAHLERRRAARDQARVDRALDRLRRAATTDENLIPLLIEAARAEATEGEMVITLKRVWGEYTEPARF